jgi:thioredoxin 1
VRVVAVSDEGLEKLLQESPLFAIAFVSRVSIPCDHFLPEYSAMPEILGNRLAFFKIDHDENPSISDELGITAVPTLLVFKAGLVLARYEGPYSRETLKERLLQVLSPKA